MNFKGCKFWNELPEEFKNLRSTASFKHELNEFLQIKLSFQ